MSTNAAQSSDQPRRWRSLAELHEEPAFLRAVEREFPHFADYWDDRASRRDFLTRMGAAFALAGLAGCVRQPEEQIVPAVEVSPQNVPGRTQFFATAMPVPGGALGLLVKSIDGRPIKIEGNPLHPASLGATDLFAQAEILNLYDPDRSQVVLDKGQISSWEEFEAVAKPRLAAHRARKGAGLHVVTGHVVSPTLQVQIDALRSDLPESKWYVHENLPLENTRAAMQQVTGVRCQPIYRLDRADVIVSIDADFLSQGPESVRLGREFAARRDVSSGGQAKPNRLYVAEPSPTLTGAAADHRLPLRWEHLRALPIAIARGVGIDVLSDRLGLPEEVQHFVQTLVADLRAAGSRGLVIVGPTQPPGLIALGLSINSALGSIGTAVTFGSRDAAPEPAPESLGSLLDLEGELIAGRVESLVVLGTNFVRTGLGYADWVPLLSKVPFKVHHGTHADETAALCDWRLPATHFLEEWSDARAADGTASIIQPLIAPLFAGRSAHELLTFLGGRPAESGYDTVRNHWRGVLGEQNFDSRWGRALHDGVVADAPVAPAPSLLPSLNPTGMATAIAQPDTRPEGEQVQLVFRPDPTLLDGRYANNAWLQELPKPFTAQVWGNAAWISPATAAQFQLADGDVVTLGSSSEHSIDIPVVRVPGQADGVVTLHLGHGRTRGGRNANGVGVDVSPLRGVGQWFGGAILKPTGRRVVLARTQHHFLMEGRDLVKSGTFAELAESPTSPHFMHAGGHHAEVPAVSLFPDWEQTGSQWGMTINLSACFGCNACVIACQSENNIPTVGPDQVRNSREMHWLRVDTYFSGDEANPEVHHQPVMCQHCEHAPCEPVCPVGATTHSSDGLNEMTYNRCIGTRYCSNNCPYKVRRFNFLDYRIDLKELPILQMAQNPEVTVRSRGVMEKCTYCVQRISAARISAEVDGRDLADVDVVTACQAVCPSKAIVFGDVANPASAVSHIKASPLNYSLLGELNTRPRTTYLAALKNPNPALAPQEQGA